MSQLSGEISTSIHSHKENTPCRAAKLSRMLCCSFCRTLSCFSPPHLIFLLSYFHLSGSHSESLAFPTRVTHPLLTFFFFFFLGLLVWKGCSWIGTTSHDAAGQKWSHWTRKSILQLGNTATERAADKAAEHWLTGICTWSADQLHINLWKNFTKPLIIWSAKTSWEVIHFPNFSHAFRHEYCPCGLVRLWKCETEEMTT